MTRDIIKREIKKVLDEIKTVEMTLATGPMKREDRDRLEAHLRELEFVIPIYRRELVYAGI